MAVRRTDLLVALGCAVVSVGAFVAVPVLETEAATPAAGSARWLGVVAVLVAQAAALLASRTAPRSALLATAAAAPVAAAIGSGDATSLTSVAVLVATYAAVLHVPWRELWPALAGAAALVTAGGVVAGLDTDAPAVEVVGGSVVQAVGSLGAALLVGSVVGARREAGQARELEALAVVREHEAMVQAAIARERTAMARELHDIAAHHLSGIAVMTAAIGTQIDTDPQGAKVAVQLVRRQSTAVLRDLRSLVGLLRDGDAGAGVRPENLGGIAALVTDATRRGQDVALTVLGAEPLGRGVGPLASLAAYRVVQEALTNAARHAPGARCEVTVDDRAEDAVLVVVRNGPGAGPRVAAGEGPGGFGLVGMRERAELTGARLEAGPHDGGWLVSLRVPRQEEPS